MYKMVIGVDNYNQGIRHRGCGKGMQGAGIVFKEYFL
jgi:hypothetical protein